MKKGLIGLLSLLMVVVLTGCGSEPAPKPVDEKTAPVQEEAAVKTDEGSGTTEEAPAAPVEEAAKTAAEGSDTAKETPAPAAAEDSEAAKEEAAAPATVDGLVGSKWKYDDIEITFKDDKKVALKGGAIAALAPDGLDADYTIKDGVFEVSVMGQTFSGTYADGKLTVDGTEAVKQQ